MATRQVESTGSIVREVTMAVVTAPVVAAVETVRAVPDILRSFTEAGIGMMQTSRDNRYSSKH